MRLPSFLTFLTSAVLLLTAAHAWAPEDHEIFRLRDEVIATQGNNATFYSFLGVSANAPQDKIKSVYRKKSTQLHPDKAVPAIIAKRFNPAKASKDKTGKKPGTRVNKGPTKKERAAISKEANEHYARFNAIANILREPELRERYDYFLKHGFPRWRGTGYYYARFRPGATSVLIGLLVVFGGGVHYGALYLGWKRQREFVGRYVSHARRTAWGNDSGIPGLGGAGAMPEVPAVPNPEELADDTGTPVALNRRQKRLQEKETKKKERGGGEKSSVKNVRANGISRPIDAEPISGPQGSRKKVIAENGKVLIVDALGDVYLEEETEEGETHEFLLDPDEIPKPSITDTALVQLPIFLYNQSVGRVIDKVKGTSTADNDATLQDLKDEIVVSTNPELDEDAMLDKSVAQNPNAEIKKRSKKTNKK